MKHILFTILIIFLITSCTDAGCGKISSLGNNASIQCFSGGQLIYEGVSTGKIQSEASSDGYYFVDKDTKSMMEVSGDCIIRYLD